NRSSDIVIIRKKDIVPLPFVLPGSISDFLAIEFTQSLDRNLSVDVAISKKVLSRWTRLPRNNRTYPDICTFLRLFRIGNCPDIPAQLNLNCIGPIAAGTYTLPACSGIVRKSILSLCSLLSLGNYQITGRFRDPITKKEVGCFEFRGTTVNAPSLQTPSLGRLLSG
ncbi:unnamed protein product, partial [Candidula unifasciata]